MELVQLWRSKLFMSFGFFYESLLFLGKKSNVFSLFLLKSGKILRKFILGFYDPLIRVKTKFLIAAGQKLPVEVPPDFLLPFSHDLPFYLLKYPFYSSNVGRIAAAVFKKYQHLTFIDIGANIGDTLVVLRQKAHFPVLCIEGDSFYFNILIQNARHFENVKCVQLFLGEQEMTIQSELEKKGGTGQLNTTASGTATISLKSLGTLVETEPEFAQSKMVKIDTDGFDAKIIRGAISWLERIKPILFFEYDPAMLSKNGDDGMLMLSGLHEAGYRYAIVYDNLGNLFANIELSDTAQLQMIHQHFSGKNSFMYCDICVFAPEDKDLFESIFNSESAFFKQQSKS